MRKNGIGKANIGAFVFLLYAKLLAASAHNFGPILFRSTLLFYSPGKTLNKHFLNKYFSVVLNAIGFSER